MRKRALRLAAAIILSGVGSVFTGCAPTPEVRYIAEPLHLPARPALPPLTAADVACLSDEAYRRLVERDTRRRQYAEELEAIIRATHPDPPDG